MDPERKVVAEFHAKFKTLVAKDGATASLDFVSDPEWTAQVASLLKLLGSAFELNIDGQIFVSAIVGQIKFNGDGRAYTRLIADTKDQVQYLQAKLDRDVSVEVSVK